MLCLRAARFPGASHAVDASRRYSFPLENFFDQLAQAFVFDHQPGFLAARRPVLTGSLALNGASDLIGITREGGALAHWLSTSTQPWCCLAMHTPWPGPGRCLCDFLGVKNGSKIRFIVSSSIPVPVSLTLRRTKAPGRASLRFESRLH